MKRGQVRLSRVKLDPFCNLVKYKYDLILLGFKVMLQQIEIEIEMEITDHYLYGFHHSG